MKLIGAAFLLFGGMNLWILARAPIGTASKRFGDYSQASTSGLRGLAPIRYTRHKCRLGTATICETHQ